MRTTRSHSCDSLLSGHLFAFTKCWLFLGYMLLLAISIRGHAQERTHPIPSKQEQDEIRKLISEVYETPVGKQLLSDAIEANDVKQKYVLLIEAGKIFIQDLDTESALQTADILSRLYGKDKLSIQMKVINAIYNKCKSKDRAPLREISKSAPQLAIELTEAGHFDDAIKMYKIAADAARKDKNTKLRRELQKQLLEAKESKKTGLVVAEKMKILENDPLNSECNYFLGAYYCFDKGDWEKGLPYLALGNDTKLTQIAKKELEIDERPAEIRDLADAWWEEADKRKKPLRGQMRARAQHWYRMIFPSLDGLDRKKIVKRLSDSPISPHYMFRDPANRILAVENNPRDVASKACVDAALRWLAAHQNTDGSWSFNHTRGDKCSGFSNPGKVPTQGPSPKMGATGMALLCFLAEGHTHQSKHSEYRLTVKKAISYLIGNMDLHSGRLYEPKGYWHYHMYSHGIAACALAEAFGMTRHQKLKVPAQKAIDYIVAAQNSKSGGWLYEPKQGGDTSVFGWQVRALKSAVAANLKIPKHVGTEANKWLDIIGFAPSESGGGFSRYGYREAIARNHSGVMDSDAAMTALGLLCRNYLGTKKDDPGQRKGVEWIGAMGPGRNNIYYNYYATMVMHLNDGPKGPLWKRWNSVMRDMLINSQVKQGNDAGSWYYSGNHGDAGGRLMSTCLATLILQNDYRYTDIE